MTQPIVTPEKRQEKVREILAFPLDAPDAPRPFRGRLAKEQGWTLAFTARVCEEYKRFLAIAAVMGHPVAPSDAVDQAWHLHLLYTQSYWEDLCKKTLGFPLHHHPASGQAEQSHTFHDWYQKTMGSYVTLFGHAPPPDIWPQKPSAGGDWRRVDARRVWIFAKPRFLRMLPWGLALAAALAPAPAHAQTLPYPPGYVSVLDLPGPDFLRLYAFLFVLAFFWFLFRRALKMQSLQNDVEMPETSDPVDLAYLAGGPERVALTVLAELLAEKSVRLHSSLHSWKLIPATQSPQGTAAGKRIWEKIRKEEEIPFQMDRIVSLLYTDCTRLEQHFALLGMRPSLNEHRALKRAGLEGYGLLLLLGLAKVWVGLDRGRPVDFLLLFLLVTVVLVLTLANNTPQLTPKGKRYLNERRSRFSPAKLKNAYFKGEIPPLFSRETSWIAAMGMALLGPGYLKSLSMPGIGPLTVALEAAKRSPQTQRSGLAGWLSDGGTSGCGSSCGSSCGGGGCGGGGCGGCGGD